MKEEHLETILEACRKSFDPNVKLALINADLYFDDFIEDENPLVRLAIANKGYNLDEYVYDEDWRVREAVAKCGDGKHLLLLYTDKDWHVRRAVADHQKLHSEIINSLVDDNNIEVRVTLALNRHKSKKLAKDPSPIVRKAVADSGKEIRKLLKDSDPKVREAAIMYGLTHDDAESKWVLRNRWKMCANCEHILDRYHKPTSRCPQCNFSMSNWREFSEEYYPSKANS